MSTRKKKKLIQYSTKQKSSIGYFSTQTRLRNFLIDQQEREIIFEWYSLVLAQESLMLKSKFYTILINQRMRIAIFCCIPWSYQWVSVICRLFGVIVEGFINGEIMALFVTFGVLMTSRRLLDNSRWLSIMATILQLLWVFNTE